MIHLQIYCTPKQIECPSAMIVCERCSKSRNIASSTDYHTLGKLENAIKSSSVHLKSFMNPSSALKMAALGTSPCVVSACNINVDQVCIKFTVQGLHKMSGESRSGEILVTPLLSQRTKRGGLRVVQPPKGFCQCYHKLLLRASS